MLEAAAAIVTPVTFSPATASGRMTIAAIDHLTLMVMPGLVLRLGQLAPGLDLEVPPAQADNVELVARGAADLALGVFEELPVAFYRRTLYEEDLVCVVRASHAVVNEGMTIERFAAMSHLQVIITGRGQTQVDAALARMGMTRRVAMRVPHFLAAAALVAESDMILSLPRRLANRMASIYSIAVLDMPLEVEPFDVTMIWHERRQDDRAHAWLRQQVVEAAQEAGLRWRGRPRRHR
jgi:DNA-binding transcriptional LysR family regulator